MMRWYERNITYFLNCLKSDFFQHNILKQITHVFNEKLSYKRPIT